MACALAAKVKSGDFSPGIVCFIGWILEAFCSHHHLPSLIAPRIPKSLPSHLTVSLSPQDQGDPVATTCIHTELSKTARGCGREGGGTRTITGAIPMAVPHGPAFQATPLLGLMVLSTSGTALEASLQDDFVSNRAAPMAQHCLMQQRPLTPLGLSQGGISLGSHTTSDKRTWRQLLRDHYRQ